MDILRRFPVFILLICISMSVCFADNRQVDIESLDPDSYAPGELIIRFAPQRNGETQSRSSRENRIRETISNARITRDFRLIEGLSLVELPSNVSVKEAIRQLRARTDVLYVEPNYKAQAFTTEPNDIQFGNLWGLNNTGQTVNGITGTADCDINAPEAWDIITDANNIVVAVIDTGVDYNHPDLAANMWINQAEYEGDPNFDDDGNGFVDDILGYDFCNDDVDPMDDAGHGTHCAGTIGAVGNNGLGVTGVCWNVRIMPIKFLSASGGGTYADAIAAVDYATTMQVDIMSNSWGGSGYSQGLEEAVQRANEAGIIFVAAAGNSGTNNDVSPAYPASFDCNNIISVMATDQDDQRALFNYGLSSNYGLTAVDLGAPGKNILSCVPYSSYEYHEGTSMATPHVAGACALVMAANPDWSPSYIKEAILNSVDIPQPQLSCVSGGRLNLASAIDYKPERLSLNVSGSAGSGSGGTGDPNDPCDCGCVVPNDLITYTIKYAPTDPCDYYYVDVTDYIPLQTYYEPPASPNDGEYSIWDQTYTWHEGTVYGLDPCDPNITLQITMRVNEFAEPLGTIINRVTIESFGDTESFNVETEETHVCCWGGDVIYVNADAPTSSYQTGISWAHAYRNLQDAVKRLSDGCGNEIWIAAGTYSPGLQSNSVFDFSDEPNTVAIYGGFAGNETSRDARNLFANPTYLTGNDTCSRIINVDSCSAGVTLDSLIIGKSTSRAIYSDASTITLSNCVVAENSQDGIHVLNTVLTIQNCVIANNGNDGVYCFGNSSAPEITNCNIYNNEGHGIDALWAYPTVKNCFIHNNGDNGIYLNDPRGVAAIRNVTIVNNDAEAIALNSGTTTPDIRNCILWYNDRANSFADLSGCTASYSCLTNPTDPNAIDYNPTPDPNGYNIQCNPLFVTADLSLGNYHLEPNSPCKDLGDTDPCEPYTNELDIDGQTRVVNTIADIGADEYSCSDVVHEGDQNDDGRINLVEFYELAALWQLSSADADPNDPNSANWNSAYDFDSDDDVDIIDLCSFSVDWAWQACYHEGPAWAMMTLSATLPDAETSSGLLSTEAIEQQQINLWKRLAPEYTPTIYERAWMVETLIDWLETIWLEDDGIQEEISEEDFFGLLFQLQDELELLYSQLPPLD